MTLQGIGYYSALMLLAKIGDLQRFPTASHLVSYAGLAPRVRASGGRVRTGPIAKAGSPWMRRVLTEAAVKAAQRPYTYLRSYYRRAQRRHGKQTTRLGRGAMGRSKKGAAHHLDIRGLFIDEIAS